MTLHNELMEIKDSIEEKQNTINKLEGQLELLMKKLNKELGFKTIKEAEREIAKRKKKNVNLLAEIKSEAQSIQRELK